MSPPSRRDFLCAAGLGLSASLAGCTGGLPLHVGTVDLGAPERESERGHTSFEFYRDEARLLDFAALYSGGYRESTRRLPLRLQVWHRRGTHLDGLRYHLDPQYDDSEFTEFYLQVPGGSPWPAVHLEQDPRGEGVHLDVPDLGVQGSGTVTLEFLLDPMREPADLPGPIPLSLGAEFTLSDESPVGREYAASVTDTVEIPKNPR